MAALLYTSQFSWPGSRDQHCVIKLFLANLLSAAPMSCHDAAPQTININLLTQFSVLRLLLRIQSSLKHSYVPKSYGYSKLFFKYTIRLIVCKVFCHSVFLLIPVPVIWSFSPRSFCHSDIYPVILTSIFQHMLLADTLTDRPH